MRKVIILFLFSNLAIGLVGQSGIKIYTKLDQAKFKIVFDGEVENTIPTKEVYFDSLDFEKPHKAVITFTADTIADIEEEFYILENYVREFEIVKKSTFLKKSAKAGRTVSNFFHFGNHDKEKVLFDVYELAERSNKKHLDN